MELVWLVIVFTLQVLMMVFDGWLGIVLFFVGVTVLTLGVFLKCNNELSKLVWSLLALIFTGERKKIVIPVSIVNQLLSRNQKAVPSFITIQTNELQSIRLYDSLRVCNVWNWLCGRQVRFEIKLSLLVGVNCRFTYSNDVNVSSSVFIKVCDLDIILDMFEKKIQKVVAKAGNFNITYTDYAYHRPTLSKIIEILKPTIIYNYSAQSNSGKTKLSVDSRVDNIRFYISPRTALLFQKMVMNWRTSPVVSKIPSRFYDVEHCSTDFITVKIDSLETHHIINRHAPTNVEDQNSEILVGKLNVEMADEEFGTIFGLCLPAGSRICVQQSSNGIRQIDALIQSIQFDCQFQSIVHTLIESKSNPYLTFTMTEILPKTKHTRKNIQHVTDLEVCVGKICLNAEVEILLALYLCVIPRSSLLSYVNLGLFSSELGLASDKYSSSDSNSAILFDRLHLNVSNLEIYVTYNLTMRKLADSLSHLFFQVNSKWLTNIRELPQGQAVSVSFSPLSLFCVELTLAEFLNRILNHFKTQFSVDWLSVIAVVIQNLLNCFFLSLAITCYTLVVVLFYEFPHRIAMLMAWIKYEAGCLKKFFEDFPQSESEESPPQDRKDPRMPSNESRSVALAQKTPIKMAQTLKLKIPFKIKNFLIQQQTTKKELPIAGVMNDQVDRYRLPVDNMPLPIYMPETESNFQISGLLHQIGNQAFGLLEYFVSLFNREPVPMTM